MDLLQNHQCNICAEVNIAAHNSGADHTPECRPPKCRNKKTDFFFFPLNLGLPNPHLFADKSWLTVKSYIFKCCGSYLFDFVLLLVRKGR